MKEQVSFPQSLKLLSQAYEIDLIKAALSHCQFNQKKTAEALNLTYHQLRGYLKKYNLLDSSLQNEG
jgi:psp operon transcriptional activator